MAMGHVIMKEFHLEKPSEYFTLYAKEKTDLPTLVMLEKREGCYAGGRFLRASDLAGNLGQANDAEWSHWRSTR